ncbi:MAG: carboxymuconolactone decarboxylase family protein [Alteromonadaceae bacterium]|jgi:alkylhydroperoxidase family enzyme|uniref:Carboxymuconolactone decarboxylase family protein n=2 Tax=Paraglaciecola chathamensis TaxID=368405 RepID=A0ABS0WI23_9ALTE|nr:MULTISPECIES: carboxymuconolactone decarboxylase family protein [Paraglaciecola]MBN27198.1 carboxymuconolactone decarboxylase family protein [Alteromonadaceae bacterium]MBJ2138088.1 carboxymuconolactone decarboxylase family protein [Paraglaciecola chathamensis]MBU3020104.1 carboxymuconolactone decarboxylase family protein [Paraglaciecola agarilytica]MDO6560698.1 carboxymuconolactone decarboxylase family protein [Paraglaciecola chathamensis]MDO6839331.1 carboxymuconolactone decarboxylase fam|tara:strand:+ start:40493 stop:41038 length:546 start_codon:yes stop_codon:yes gene_type:complete
MTDFTLHTVETAPEKSKPILEQSQKTNGMLPNLHAVMAEAPGLLEGYQVLHKLFMDSSFDAEELTVVWQTINVEHNCTYCVPAHTAIAHSMKVSDDLIEALRNTETMPTEKLQVLHETTLAMVRERGIVSDDVVQKFYAAGYGQRQLLEIILCLSQKVMSNYTNHVAETPLDEPFKKFAWK